MGNNKRNKKLATGLVKELGFKIKKIDNSKTITLKKGRTTIHLFNKK